MKTHQLLASVYRTATCVIASCMLLICLVFQWSTGMTLLVLAASLVISAPAVISLHAICWVYRRIAVSPVFAWMLLMAIIPLLVVAPALLLVKTLPGDLGFLIVLGMMSAYAGILGHGISIAQLFKSAS